MANIAVLKHFWCEGPEAFADTLVNAGHRITTINLYQGDPVPAPDDFDAWLIMGGPMNVDDIASHPYLRPERDLVADLIRRDRPVLGICLGAQIVARAAGARVYPLRPKEIGLFDVALTPRFMALWLPGKIRYSATWTARWKSLSGMEIRSICPPGRSGWPVPNDSSTRRVDWAGGFMACNSTSK